MASQVPPEVLEPIAAAARDTGVEVYHAEISGRELRVQVESQSGVSVRACTEFSHALTTRLDAADFLHRQYTLEVSTPGVERRLYQPQDYVKAVNQHVRVHTRDGVVEGRLEAAGPTSVTIRTESGPVPVTREYPFADIREARIRVSDSELFARSRTAPEPIRTPRRHEGHETENCKEDDETRKKPRCRTSGLRPGESLHPVS